MRTPLLPFALFALTASSLAHAQQPAPPPAFDTVSIKLSPYHGASRGFSASPTPDGYRVKAQSLWNTISVAYSPGWSLFQGSIVASGPDWTRTTLYDIDARIDPKDAGAWAKQTPHDHPLMNAMLQTMLRERFHLALHTVPGEMPIYSLVVEGKLKLEPADPARPMPPGANLMPDGGGVVWETETEPRRLYNVTIDDLSRQLTLEARRKIVDATGLHGRYNVVLHFWSEGMTDAEEKAVPAPDGAHRWKLADLGLALKPGIAPVDKLVIDHVEPPTPN